MATDGINYEMTGLPELLGKLDAATSDMKRKGGRSALRKAAQAIRDQARQNAEGIDDPRSPENISLNIVERWSGRTFKQTGNMMFRVGVLGGAKPYANTRENVRKQRAGQYYSTGGDTGNPGGDTFHWRFLEFGTEEIQARPFMRPAADQASQKAVSEFIKHYGKSLDRALKRARKRQV
jgi:HK97 gp10 family phage protein